MSRDIETTWFCDVCGKSVVVKGYLGELPPNKWKEAIMSYKGDGVFHNFSICETCAPSKQAVFKGMFLKLFGVPTRSEPK